MSLLIIILFTLTSCIQKSSLSVISTDTSESCTMNNFKLSSESHMLIEVYFMEHSESTQVVYTERVDPLLSFPKKVNVKSFIPPDLTKEYYVNAKVFQKSGDTLRIGDFLSETATPVSHADIELTCLESCQSKNVGGFCSDRT